MIKVTNPADGTLIGEAPEMTLGEVTAAVDRTCRAFPIWSRKIAKERSELLRCWFEMVKDDRRAFAEMIVKENGKCLSEAMGEIDYGLGFIEWYAEEAKRVYGDTIPTHSVNSAVMVVKEPSGAAAAITPWNFPFMMITRKVATALAAGCTVVVKPSEQTPLTAYKLLEYARKAGIPEGVFEMVTGNPKEIGEVFLGEPRIRRISFTGSTAVGKMLASACGPDLKRMTLELGGNAPFIVFEDAHFDDAVDGLVAAKLRNSGRSVFRRIASLYKTLFMIDLCRRLPKKWPGFASIRVCRKSLSLGRWRAGSGMTSSWNSSRTPSAMGPRWRWAAKHTPEVASFTSRQHWSI